MTREPTIGHPTGRPNFTIVDLGRLRLAYSYRTAIGYNAQNGRGWILRENEWGPTTGRHLNYLERESGRNPGDRTRLPAEQFARDLAAALDGERG